MPADPPPGLVDGDFASGGNRCKGPRWLWHEVPEQSATEGVPGMSKEMHTVRVWAWRDGTRELAFSVDAPDARRAALAHVRTLQEEPSVSRIEMREHTVTARGDDDEYAGGVRGSSRLGSCGRSLAQPQRWQRPPRSSAGLRSRRRRQDLVRLRSSSPMPRVISRGSGTSPASAMTPIWICPA